MADDAAAILDELGIDRADIVGFSGGSVTAQELAIRHPEQVKSLVLVGTFGKGDRYFDAVVRMFTWMIDQAPYPHAFLEAFYLWIYTAQAHDSGFVDQLIEDALAFPHQQSLESMHQQLDAWGHHNTLDRLGQVHAPTLVIAGGKDLVSRRALVRRSLTHPRRPIRGMAGGGPPTLPGRPSQVQRKARRLLDESER